METWAIGMHGMCLTSAVPATNEHRYFFYDVRVSDWCRKKRDQQNLWHDENLLDLWTFGVVFFEFLVHSINRQARMRQWLAPFYRQFDLFTAHFGVVLSHFISLSFPFAGFSVWECVCFFYSRFGGRSHALATASRMTSAEHWLPTLQ